MDPQRITAAHGSACPTCSGTEAVVRVRGNAVASTCTTCRRVDVSPLLDEYALSAVLDDHAPADVVPLPTAELARIGVRMREVEREVAVSLAVTFQPVPS